MDVFKRYYISLVDLEQASESVKLVTGTCLQKRRNQYIIAAMHIILLLILLFVLALCLCMLFNMHSEFSRLKERVDVLEMSRFVDPRSGVNEFTSLHHQVNPGLKKKVTSVDSPNYFDDVDTDVVVSIVPSTEKYSRDIVDDSKFTERTRQNKINFQSVDVDILSNDNTEIENIQGDSGSDNDDWERYEKEIIEEEAEEEDELDKEIADVDKYGDIVLSPESVRKNTFNSETSIYEVLYQTYTFLLFKCLYKYHMQVVFASGKKLACDLNIGFQNYMSKNI